MRCSVCNRMPPEGESFVTEARRQYCSIECADKYFTEDSSHGENRIFKEQKQVKPSQVLRAGAKHMEDRAATYDNPAGERSMKATVTAFNSITGQHLTEEQGWMMMALLKMVRSQQGQFKLDNYEDGAAYFALAAEAGAGERDPEGLTL